MVDILDGYHKLYVPKVPISEDVNVPGSNERVELQKNLFYNIGIGKISDFMPAY